MLLQEMKHHSIVQLADVFGDAEYVHLVTDLCKGGELFDMATLPRWREMRYKLHPCVVSSKYNQQQDTAD